MALLRPGAVVLSAGSCRGQGPNLATTTPVDARCQEGARARGRTCVRECVYACVRARESVRVCASRRGELSPPGHSEVNSGQSRSLQRSGVQGVCTADGCVDVAVAAAAAL